jgi:hypothetical protein
MDLLRAATLDTDRAAAAWRRWISTHVINDAYHRSTDLLPAVSANLSNEVLGHEADRLRGLRRRGWFNTQFRLEAMVDALALLEPLGVRPILAKGAALSTTVYAEPGLRPIADVDLVIGSDDFDDALAAFAAAGWRRPTATLSPYDHAVEVVDQRGRSIDLHRWVLFPRFSLVPEDDWMERSVPYSVRGCDVFRFRCADELVLTVLHGLLVNSASSVRWPLDVVQLARDAPAVEGVTPEAFWSEVAESASAIAAGPVVANALEMCRVELDANIPSAFVEQLVATPLDRSLAQHWTLCRRGITLEWRLRRYSKVERATGRRPTIRGYVGPRVEALKSKGISTTLSVRADRVKQVIADQRRD